MKKWLDDLYAIILKRGFKTLDDSLKNYENTENLINNNKYNLISTQTINAGESYTLDLSEIGITGNMFFTLVGLSNHPAWFFSRVYKQYDKNFYIQMNPSNSSGFNINYSSERIVTITNTTSIDLTVSLYYILVPYNPI